LSKEDIQSFDRMIGPEGQALPPRHGTAKEGADVPAVRVYPPEKKPSWY
jgi:hypothetical protein